MTETRLSIRIDSATKKNAEAVFDALGLTMSAAVNLFLSTVVRNRGIPFSLELGDDPLESRMRRVVRTQIAAATAIGSPVALFDETQNRPYLEYPDGKRVYELD
jgi:DNA-damage-inducible protein J